MRALLAPVDPTRTAADVVASGAGTRTLAVDPVPARAVARWRWPLTATLAWTAAWLAAVACARAGLGAGLAVSIGLAVATAPLLAARRLGLATPLRRLVLAAGFPMLLLATHAAGSVPPLAWTVPLVLLVVAYPVSAWNDAPVFPTPRGALSGLATPLDLPARPRLHDAGCGLGDGLRALRDAWPDGRVSGTERSLPWRLVSAIRCPWATVRLGDMWLDDWSSMDVVYLFQRPESMPRAMAKARREMRPGAWLVSLEFDVPGHEPDASCDLGGGRQVRAWRMPPSDDSTPSGATSSRVRELARGRPISRNRTG